MGRLVKAVTKTDDARLVADDGNSPTKNYFENVGKYVPAEIIAGFTAVNTSLYSLEHTMRFYSLLVSFIVFAIFTPIYFRLIALPEEKPSVKTQQIVSFVAFLIWSYAMTGANGLFGKEGFNIYFDPISTALMVIFSFVSGFITPKK